MPSALLCIWLLCTGATALHEKPISQFIWVGGVTNHSAEIRLRGYKGNFLRLNHDIKWQNVTKDLSGLRFDGLAPLTKYQYFVHETRDTLSERLAEGSFSTFPVPNEPTDFRFSMGALMKTGFTQVRTDPAVIWDSMAARQPAFMIHGGDMHVDDIDGEYSEYQRSYLVAVGAPNFQKFLRAHPVAYIWDDHDFAGKDSNSGARNRAAARHAYHNNVPHYPLIARANHSWADSPIYQAFTYGRVRFLLTDLRSESKGKNVLGEEQMRWFESELRVASTRSLIIWVSSMAWNTPTKGWGAFPVERDRIANMIADLGVTNLLMIAGDFHGMGVDDGSNTDFSSSGDAGFPLFQVAPLAHMGTSKSTSVSKPRFSHSCRGFNLYPNFHFGTMDVIEQDIKTCIAFSGFVDGTESLVYKACAPFTSDKHTGVHTECALEWLPTSLLLFYIIACGFFLASLLEIFLLGRTLLHSYQKFLTTLVLFTIPFFPGMVLVSQGYKFMFVVHEICKASGACVILFFFGLGAFLLSRIYKHRHDPEGHWDRWHQVRLWRNSVSKDEAAGTDYRRSRKSKKKSSHAADQ